jgi:hypothetical protein
MADYAVSNANKMLSLLGINSPEENPQQARLQI